jgi:hypothetical protein
LNLINGTVSTSVEHRVTQTGEGHCEKDGYLAAGADSRWPFRLRQRWKIGCSSASRDSVPSGRGSPKQERTLKEFLDFIRSYEWIDWWRFELCVIVSLALAGLVYLLVVDGSLGCRISLAVVIVGSMTGLIWQWRKRRMI